MQLPSCLYNPAMCVQQCFYGSPIIAWLLKNNALRNLLDSKYIIGLQLCGSAQEESNKSGVVVSAVLHASARFNRYVDYPASIIQLSK
jgi:hypothetical protein